MFEVSDFELVSRSGDSLLQHQEYVRGSMRSMPQTPGSTTALQLEYDELEETSVWREVKAQLAM